MAKPKAMKIHPVCRMFGQIAPLSKAERAEMTESIKNTGIQVPILVNKKRDTILDGATRWQIAYDLGLVIPADKIEAFESDDAKDITSVIMARNMHRRHMTEDQRVAVVSQMRGPELEKEAKERQSKAGTFKGKAPLNGKGSVVEQVAKDAGVSKHKAEQAEKARKAGLIDDVRTGKTKLREAAKKAEEKAPKKSRTQKAEMPFADAVYKKWSQWINKFPHPQRREVIALVRLWVAEKPAAEAKKEAAAAPTK